MSCRRHDDWRPPRFEGDPRDCAFPCGWGRRAQPEPPRRPWWAGPALLLFLLVGAGAAVFVFFAVRGLIR